MMKFKSGTSLIKIKPTLLRVAALIATLGIIATLVAEKMLGS